MYAKGMWYDNREEVCCRGKPKACNVASMKKYAAGVTQRHVNGIRTEVCCRGKPNACDVAPTERYAAGLCQRQASWQLPRRTL